jgi:hypothetical protein
MISIQSIQEELCSKNFVQNKINNIFAVLFIYLRFMPEKVEILSPAIIGWAILLIMNYRTIVHGSINMNYQSMLINSICSKFG